jgi:UDP-N-acetylmuramoylalanine--D-glutamate ligase
VILGDSRVLILGMGVTGRAASAALEKVGARVVTVDRAQPADHPGIEDVNLSSFDLVIASPGWPPHGDALTAVEAAEIPVWSEVELAWHLRAPSTPWLVVTGTNGKTTTVQMVGSMAAAAGLRCAVVGNVGEPVVATAGEPLDLLVVEVSSFQLHYTFSVSPLASVCLNVDDDHLDWHGSPEAYRADKARVYAHTTVACLYPEDSADIDAMVREADVEEGCRAIGLTLGVPMISQLGLVEDILVDRAFLENRQNEAFELARIEDLAHLTAGDVPPYLIANALAAAGLARAAGIDPEYVGEGLRTFRLDYHRTAHVATVDGVAYVDDSKATNPHAARAAFGGIAVGTAVWIVGGLTKGADLAPLVRDVADRLRAAVIIGLDSSSLAAAFERHAPGIPVTVIPAGDTVMERAVRVAREYARPGDIVLMSPACASMDQFRDYADRGDAFATAVGALAK